MLYALDYLSIAVGFIASIGALLVYGIGGAVTRGAQWWTNDYGRMVMARGLVLAWLYYKGFFAVFFQHAPVLRDTQYEIGSVVFSVVMVWTFWIHVKLVRDGARLRKLRLLEEQISELRDKGVAIAATPGDTLNPDTGAE